jgi:hypothetical protein
VRQQISKLGLLPPFAAGSASCFNQRKFEHGGESRARAGVDKQHRSLGIGSAAHREFGEIEFHENGLVACPGKQLRGGSLIL